LRDVFPADFGLDLVFHPHVATYVETPEEMAEFFDATAASGVGLCLDTGHCVYAGGDPVAEAEKYQSILRFVHIKDVDAKVMAQVRKSSMNFAQAIAAGAFTIIGQGSVNFRSFFETLRTDDYSGWMVVEQDVTYGATKIPPVESVTASLRYLQKM
jgi:inosose dehydratase